MQLDKHTLLRQDDIVGTITGIRVLQHGGQTCYSGRFTPADVNPRVKQLFEYFHAVLTMNRIVGRPPMPGFYFQNWCIEIPGGWRSDIRFPYLNLDTKMTYCPFRSQNVGPA